MLRKLRYIRIVKNPFFLITIGFIVWIVFFDSYSLIEHHAIDQEIDKMEEKREYFQNEIDKDKQSIKNLKDGDAIEKYAREKYYMKRDNEDIFIIEFDTLSSS
ncbi:FtsB family cell division protein [Myroides sp. C15-4]|uniref:FtsB family cell division protein n=1 Tax=Myroides sp. C15-4 TaxID=3400532 RepID=UPI003D2F7DB4